MKVSIQLILFVFFSLEEEVIGFDDSTTIKNLLVEYPVYFPNGKEYNWPYFISARQEKNNEIIPLSVDEKSKDSSQEKLPFRMNELKNNHIDENPTNTESEYRRDRRSAGVHTHSHGYIHVHTHVIRKREVPSDVNLKTEGELADKIIKKENLVEFQGEKYEDDPTLPTNLRKRRSHVHTHTHGHVHTHSHGHIHVHAHGVYKRSISENVNKNLIQQKNSILIKRNAYPGFHTKSQYSFDNDGKRTKRMIDSKMTSKNNPLKEELNLKNSSSLREKRSHGAHTHTHSHGHIHVHTHGSYK